MRSKKDIGREFVELTSGVNISLSRGRWSVNGKPMNDENLTGTEKYVVNEFFKSAKRDDGSNKDS